MGTNPTELRQILLSIEACHQHLTDIFPHEGLKAGGGSRLFLGGALSPVLQKCFDEIRVALHRLSGLQAREDLESLWKEGGRLFARVEKEGRNGNAARIDEAVTLLFLISGTTWNLLSLELGVPPPHDERCSKVEPMSVLLKRCNRQEEGIDLNVFSKKLRDEAVVSLRRPWR
jgi:hypothetical protein